MKWLFKWVMYDQLEIENQRLASENQQLKAELLLKGSVFFEENKYLGINETVYGVVVDGEIKTLTRNFGIK